MKYQYKIIVDTNMLRWDYIEETLNEIGEEGWELVNLINNATVFIFKRPNGEIHAPTKEK